MITFDQAHAIAVSEVENMARRSRLDIVLSEGATREEDWCWTFSYNTREYLETRRVTYALAGNGPILVEKESGAVRRLGTGRPVEEQLKELRGA